MSPDTFMDGCLWAVLITALAMPVWLVLWPPRMAMHWPLLIRPVIATVFSEAAIYFLIFCVAYPAAWAFASGHPGVLQCYPILCLPPSYTWIVTAALSMVVLAIRQFVLS